MTSSRSKEIIVGNGLVVEHVRAELLRLLVKIHYFTNTEQMEHELKKLILQVDDIQFAYNIYEKQEQLDLEPVNISEIKDQIFHKIYKDKSYENIRLNCGSKFIKPVLAHRLSLTKSLESMIYSVIDVAPDNSQSIDIEISRSPDGVKIGVYRDSFYIDANLLRRFRNNIQLSSRPSSALSPFTTANLFIADTLLDAMGFNLRTSISKKRRGLSTTLPLSSQLKLIVI